MAESKAPCFTGWRDRKRSTHTELNACARECHLERRPRGLIGNLLTVWRFYELGVSRPASLAPLTSFKTRDVSARVSIPPRATLSSQGKPYWLHSSRAFRVANFTVPGLTDEERAEARKQSVCVECEDRRITRNCDQCGDGYCTKCYEKTHAHGRRAKHAWKHFGPMECAECEKEVWDCRATDISLQTKLPPRHRDSEQMEDAVALARPTPHPIHCEPS